jgi:hypothetical protein
MTLVLGSAAAFGPAVLSAIAGFGGGVLLLPVFTAFQPVPPQAGPGSALPGSVGPLTGPFFLAYGLTRAAYIGTEAAGALTMHRRRSRRTAPVIFSPERSCCTAPRSRPPPSPESDRAKKIVGRISDRVFVLLVEIGLVAAGILFLIGW